MPIKQSGRREMVFVNETGCSEISEIRDLIRVLCKII